MSSISVITNYALGDSIGVYARNAPALVDAVLKAANISPDSPVSVSDKTHQRQRSSGRSLSATPATAIPRGTGSSGSGRKP